MFTRQHRVGLTVYLYYNRDARKLLKYGDLYYHSKKSRFLVLYVNKEDVEDKVSEIQKLKFIKEVSISEFDRIDHQFVGNLHRQESELVSETI
ncbi:DUF2129 domain-containing protein [Streptococcus iniae]|uniref:UPF0298 protein DIY07_07395 n=1 Tax=Streptococcus iniae TaxID=1346 RepID=A0A1J0N0I5_STRIN|nr:YlbG family protein [Streptococcus iniae]AGM99304.1 hypothetical protein K710_1546 [Streptococcus iniae SF1]AHY16239.1 hypothetical protein DQ08_07210 [Streptococcus iniae]AHY18103.1 hypothetical protein DW64_07195 [Streptococcus iniae]AJG26391.1 hypothetical protein SI82_07315 [Streptococcus iniae]APD32269.1 hypothetical protein BMF34_07240 [Streptococcus iniae]